LFLYIYFLCLLFLPFFWHIFFFIFISSFRFVLCIHSSFFLSLFLYQFFLFSFFPSVCSFLYSNFLLCFSLLFLLSSRLHFPLSSSQQTTMLHTVVLRRIPSEGLCKAECDSEQHKSCMSHPYSSFAVIPTTFSFC